MSELLSIVAKAPVISQAADSFHERLSTEAETFTITADVGFDKAGFILRGSAEYLKAWFRSGLGRDVVWRGPDGSVIWEGYVAKLALTEGSLARSRALPVANRVILVYAQMDGTTNPPEAGEQTVLTVDDTDSQASYGVISVVLSGGELTTTEAVAMAYSKLAELARVQVDEQATPGRGAPPVLKVDLDGYSSTLDWFNYVQTAVSGTVSVNSLLAAILATDPNGIISTSAVNVQTNATQVQAYRDGKVPSWKLIQQVVDVGDGSSFRLWVAGIYEGRRLTYKQAETVDARGEPLAANQKLIWYKNPDDPADRIFDAAGREVLPWRARPDRIIYSSGYGKIPKYCWQSVFVAPWSLQLKSVDINPLLGMVRA
jgi:hypothetical protein